MRRGLRHDPKVIAMARELSGRRDFMNWWGDPVRVTCHEHVTEIVTFANVTRVTVCALLDVWASLNNTLAEDGKAPFMCLQDIDDIAEIPGFGEAMQSVGWVLELDDASLVFPNFSENNSPSKSRDGNAKSGAERAKAYRDKKKAEKEAMQTVTPSRNVTTEKRREEKSKELRTSLSLNNVIEQTAPPAKPIEQPKEARERVLGDGAELNHWQELMKRINALKPEWGKPAHWNASEMHALYGGSGAQMLELTDDDWELLTRYLRTTMTPEQKEFWQPRSRSKFVDTFPNVWESCDRWAKKNQPKKTNDNSIFY